MLNLILKKKSSAAVNDGYPWIFKGDFEESNFLDLAKAGELVTIVSFKGKTLGTAYFNPHTKLAARMLAYGNKQKIDQEFFTKLITRALEKRSALQEDFYRLIFSEGDFLPGLVVDRFGDYLSIQVTTAGMWNLKEFWLPILEDLLKPKGILIDHESEFASKEQMPLGLDIVGSVPDIVEVIENKRCYFANLKYGQKTGWFFDQRANREFFKNFVKNKAENNSFLDLYTHSGGFALAALEGGAKRVTLVDRSELGLNLAKKAVEQAGQGKYKGEYFDKATFIKDDIFTFFEKNAKENDQKYDIVNADPPAFIKDKKDLVNGLKGYEKLTKNAINLVKEKGIFAITSCSHHARSDLFEMAVFAGINKTGRKAKLIHKAGADIDHPLHPMLAESEYLKFLVFEIG